LKKISSPQKGTQSFCFPVPLFNIIRNNRFFNQKNKKPPSGGTSAATAAPSQKLPLACRANSPATGATANDVIPPLTPFPVGGMIVQ
jgi:hypothetical protein